MKTDSRPRPKAHGGKAKKRKLRPALWLVLVLGVLLLGAAWFRGWDFRGKQPPAPDAPEARRWKGNPPAPPENEKPPTQPIPKITFEKEPGPVIRFENVPEVPERLLGPSPPIEEKS